MLGIKFEAIQYKIEIITNADIENSNLFSFCLYNSFPERRIVEFCGAEGSGKTTTAYLVAASYQRKELERNPENPRGILFVDLEAFLFKVKSEGLLMTVKIIE